MKKNSRIIGVMCMAALLAVGSTSCKKEKETANLFTFELPAAAGFESGDEKGYVDITTSGNPMKWWDGDKLMIYSVDETNTVPVTAEYTITEGQGTTLAQFTGETLDKGSYGYFAFYPSSKVYYNNNSPVAEGNRAYFTVEPTQTYDPALNFAGTAYEGRIFMDPQGVVEAATCEMINGNQPKATLKHIFGFANVRVKKLNSTANDKKVMSIKIVDKRVHLSGGYVSLRIPDITNARLNALETYGANLYNTGDVATYSQNLATKLQEMGYESQGLYNNVTLDCSAANGIELTNKNKFFILPLRPGALVGEFDVVVTYEGGGEDVRTFKTTDAGHEKYIIRPGYFTNIQITL